MSTSATTTPTAPRDAQGRRLRTLSSHTGQEITTPFSDVQAANLVTNHRESFARGLADKILRRRTLTHEQTIWLHKFAVEMEGKRPAPLPALATPSAQPAQLAPVPAEIAPYLRPLSRGYAELARAAAPIEEPDDSWDIGDPFAE